MTLDEALAILRTAPPLRGVRVSSAQARGYAKQFAYWGAVRYRIRWSDRLGWPVATPIERASSDRRSLELAERDAAELAAAEKRFPITSIGRLSEDDVIQLAQDYMHGAVAPSIPRR